MKKQETKIFRTVGIKYLENSFSDEELNNISNILSAENIKLKTCSTPPKYTMCLEELFAHIQILLSPDIVALFSSLLYSGVYDAIKSSLKYIWQICKKKKIKKITKDKIEEISPVIHVNIGDLKAILPIDMPQEKYEYFVDKLFDSLNKDTISSERFAIFDEKENVIKYYTKTEVAFRHQKVKEENN